MQRASIGTQGERFEFEEFAEGVSVGVAAGTLSTRFSMRTPHWPGRYRPGSMVVIMPGSIAMFASGIAFVMLCGPSWT